MGYRLPSEISRMISCMNINSATSLKRVRNLRGLERYAVIYEYQRHAFL